MEINFTNQPVENGQKFAREDVLSLEKSPSKNETVSSKSNQIKTEELKNLHQALERENINLKFSRDAETKQLVIELVDSKTGDAIRQIPSEVSLRLSAAFAKLNGQFVDEKV